MSDISGCFLGARGKPPDTVLLGNSHLRMYGPTFEANLDRLGRQAFMPIINGCKPLLGVNRTEQCLSRLDRFIRAIAETASIDLVIIGFDWELGLGHPSHDARDGPVELSVERTMQGLDRTIDLLKAHGMQVALIGPLVMPNQDLAWRAAHRVAAGLPIEDLMIATENAAFMARWQPALRKYASDPRLVAFAQPHLWQCPDGCLFFMDGVSLFADNSHLTKNASRRLDGMIAVMLANAAPPPDGAH